ncbi:hypothetical protein BU17DRAFT_64858 [Hysterangium stoloniferum]|nr:hypothetical protein BU17DRAFT_64858 [Hysterangium stoloniferum]
MSSSVAPIHFAFDNTVGAELIGVLVSVLLYGISLVQVYIYFQTFPDDSKYLKTLVTAICVMTTISSILLCHGLYYYVVTNFVNPLALRHDIWSWVYEALLQPRLLYLSSLRPFSPSESTCVSPAKSRQRDHSKTTAIVGLALIASVAVVQVIKNPETGDNPGKIQQYAIMPNNTIFWAFAYISCGSYTNALLASDAGPQLIWFKFKWTQKFTLGNGRSP